MSYHLLLGRPQRRRLRDAAIATERDRGAREVRFGPNSDRRVRLG